MRPFIALRMRMVEYDMPQVELAKAVGISTATISFRLNAKSPFNTAEINAIAKVLDISPQDYYKYFFEGVKH